VLPVHAAGAPTSSSGNFPSKGGLDCNGYSLIQAPLKPGLICADPSGKNGLFQDNGYYVGHDEPSVRFISHAAGSGNTVVFRTVLPTDNTSAGGVPSYQDFPTFWLGMAVCDNNSYPQQTCVKDSNTNTGLGVNKTDAGSAVLELQFYPPQPTFTAPGFAGSVTGCESGPTTLAATKWCAALNIDSLECTFAFVFCNPRCIEPVNFAFLTKDGLPVGPPSPQLQNTSTFFGNQSDIFRMNPGDTLKVSIHDTANGLFTGIEDVTTGKSGFMVASAQNGFMNTNLHTCAGTPYTFHPEYSSASAHNIVPWTALQLGVSLAVETGHFEFPDPSQDPARGGDNTNCFTGPQGLVCFGTDFDFDGIPYVPTGWPTTTTATAMNAMPVTLLATVAHMIGPKSLGVGYPTFEFETDIGFTLSRAGYSCNILVPNSCELPNSVLVPTFGGLYPYYSVAGCRAVFGNVTGTGINDFGGDAGWGSSVAVFTGTTAIYGDTGAFYTNSC
jgi:hypothetical protein